MSRNQPIFKFPNVPGCTAILCSSTRRAARTACRGSSETGCSECPDSGYSELELQTIHHLVRQLDPGLVLVVHGHAGAGPPVRDIPHAVQVHVHDACIQTGLAVEGNLDN